MLIDKNDYGIMGVTGIEEVNLVSFRHEYGRTLERCVEIPVQRRLKSPNSRYFIFLYLCSLIATKFDRVNVRFLALNVLSFCLWRKQHYLFQLLHYYHFER